MRSQGMKHRKQYLLLTILEIPYAGGDHNNGATSRNGNHSSRDGIWVACSRAGRRGKKASEKKSRELDVVEKPRKMKHTRDGRWRDRRLGLFNLDTEHTLSYSNRATVARTVHWREKNKCQPTETS